MSDSISPEEYAFLQSQQPTQQGNDPNALYADMVREERVNNIIQQINPDNLMVEIEHRIRGERKDIVTGEWVAIDKNAKPINDKLVANFMSFLGSALNQNTSLSNFSPTEINNLMKVIIEYVEDDLDANCKEYEIEGNFSEMTRIGNIICFSVFAVLKRAQNGMESRKIFSALRVSEQLGMPQQKKGGMLDFMKFW